MPKRSAGEQRILHDGVLEHLEANAVGRSVCMVTSRGMPLEKSAASGLKGGGDEAVGLARKREIGPPAGCPCSLKYGLQIKLPCQITRAAKTRTSPAPMRREDSPAPRSSSQTSFSVRFYVMVNRVRKPPGSASSCAQWRDGNSLMNRCCLPQWHHNMRNHVNAARYRGFRSPAVV